MIPVGDVDRSLLEMSFLSVGTSVPSVNCKSRSGALSGDVGCVLACGALICNT